VDVAHRAARVGRALHDERVRQARVDVGHLVEPRVDALEEVLREPREGAEARRRAEHEAAGGEDVVDGGVDDVEGDDDVVGAGVVDAGEDGVAQPGRRAGARVRQDEQHPAMIARCASRR
jgi:hypothetical protein